MQLCQSLADLVLLSLVGAGAGGSDEALLGRDQIGEGLLDPKGFGSLVAGVFEVKGHRGRLRRLTDT